MVLVLCGWASFYQYQLEQERNGTPFSYWLVIFYHVSNFIVLYSDIRAHITNPGIYLPNHRYDELRDKSGDLHRLWSKKIDDEKLKELKMAKKHSQLSEESEELNTNSSSSN